MDKSQNKSRTIDLRQGSQECEATVPAQQSPKSASYVKQEVQSGLLKGEDGELSNEPLDPKIKDKEVSYEDYNTKIKTSK